MSINLLDMLKDQVTGSLAKQASSFLGESESSVTNALGGAFPALLGSLISGAEKPAGAQGIMNMVDGLDMGMLGDIGSLFGGGASSVNGLLNSGGGILETLLGSKMGGVVDLISKVSGMKSGSSSSLLKMAAPFLIGMIGKQIKGKGLSALTDLLGGQKKYVADALPSGMGNLLGLGFAEGLGKVSDTVSSTVKSTASAAHSAVNTTKEVANTGMGWIKWALPLLLLGGLAYWLFTKGGAEKMVDTATNAVETGVNVAKDAGTAVVNTTTDMANAVSDFAMSAFSAVDDAAKAALDKMTFTANSAGAQMMDFINGGFKGDGKVTFRNLTFDTGSAVIAGESGVEVDNLAAILKAYPNVKISIDGYTDNVGDATANKTLSDARAQSVRGRLIASGISASRISTNGYGDANPVASNDTEEGRAQNRRIEVSLVK